MVAGVADVLPEAATGLDVTTGALLPASLEVAYPEVVAVDEAVLVGGKEFVGVLGAGGGAGVLRPVRFVPVGELLPTLAVGTAAEVVRTVLEVVLIAGAALERPDSGELAGAATGGVAFVTTAGTLDDFVPAAT